MPIPRESVPIVLEVLKGVSEIVGDVVMNVAKQQHPELNEEPVPDAGAELDAAREAAIRKVGDTPPASG